MNQDGWAAPDTSAESGGSAPDGVGVAAPTHRGGAVSTMHQVPVPLRPLRLIDILDGAFNVIKQRPRTVIGVTAVFVLPLQLLTAYVSRDQLGDTFDLSRTSISAVFQDSGVGPVDLLLVYVATIPLMLVGAMLGRLVAGWYGGVETDGRALLVGLGPRLPALLGCWLLIHLAETVALGTCVGPLFVWPMALCCAPAIGAEDLGLRAAVRRTWTLGSRRYWSLFWVAISSGIVAYIVTLSLSVLPSVLADVIGPTWGWLVLAAGNTASTLITVPFVAAAATLAYLDVRMRTEALDLELRAVEILGSA